MFKTAYVRKSVFPTLLVATVCILFNCSNDENEESKRVTVDITDPNSVSESIKIGNATFMKGNPPSPSADQNAPILSEPDEDAVLLGIEGSKLIVSNYLESGSAAGFYIKVTGADGYYKVTSAEANSRLRKAPLPKAIQTLYGSRTKQSDGPSFSIQLPEDFTPGEFCIEYCVFDAQNRVSNIIERCILIAELGGEGSSFLTENEWSIIKKELSDGWNHEIQLTGETKMNMDSSASYCNDEWIAYAVTEEYRTDYEYYTFKTDGILSGEGKYYEKYEDWQEEACEPAYIENTYVEQFEAGWSYNEDTKTLIIIYEFAWEAGTEVFVNEYDAAIKDGNLVLTMKDKSYRGTFEPKK